MVVFVKMTRTVQNCLQGSTQQFCFKAVLTVQVLSRHIDWNYVEDHLRPTGEMLVSGSLRRTRN